MGAPRTLLLACLILALALLHNISPRYYKKKKNHFLVLMFQMY